MKNFALIGVAGYIAPRHLIAIKETGNNLLVGLDPFDSVGIIDRFFPKADFFTEPERFDRHLDKLRRLNNGHIDYVSICSPNYLHDSHIRIALRNQADAICEKPVVLNPWNLEALGRLEKETGKKIFTIMQLRHHPAILALKKKVEQGPAKKMYDIDLTYITSRGRWYNRSWKGNLEKSGGVATNIGVHFFDMLAWVFGEASENVLHLSEPGRAAGCLQLKKARVRWFLSINSNDLPVEVKAKGQPTYRNITVNGEAIEFSDGFADLHTVNYQHILNNKGCGLNDAMPSISIVHTIRNTKPIGAYGDYHPFVKGK